MEKHEVVTIHNDRFFSMNLGLCTGWPGNVTNETTYRSGALCALPVFKGDKDEKLIIQDLNFPFKKSSKK